MTRPKPTDSEYLPSILELMVSIRKYWTTANGEPELKEFAEYVQDMMRKRDQQRLTAALGKMQTIPLSDYDRTEVKAALIVALGPDNSKTKEKTT